MKFGEDPRIHKARRALILAWSFFSAYLLVIFISSYFLGVRPLVLGFPLWVAVGNILVPVGFVLALIGIVEKFFPEVSSLEDQEERGQER